MKTLALRIYLVVVAVLLTFALVTGWLAQRNVEHERLQAQSQSAQLERLVAWAELIENSLPGLDAPIELQRQVLLDWSSRLRLPLALDDPYGHRIAISPILEARLVEQPQMGLRLQRVILTDGRSLWMLRPPYMAPRPRPEAASRLGMPPQQAEPWLPMPGWLGPPGVPGGPKGLLTVLVVLFVAIAIAAWPVAAGLTRRLRVLRQGMERFGRGELQHRVQVEGKDEVADVARSFNDAAQRIEDLITAHRSLLANASHELRSPLARMKMAISLLSDIPADQPDHAEQVEQLKREIHQDIGELDALVEEVLLASRLDARPQLDLQPVNLQALLAEEAQRVGATLHAPPPEVPEQLMADERLLRRAVRNLLENARRYGRAHDAQSPIDVKTSLAGNRLEIAVEDQGPGVPPEQRDRIFEPFYRMPGHAEYAGGVGLGLSLVAQIASRHGGRVRVEAHDPQGSRFVLNLPTGHRASDAG